MLWILVIFLVPFFGTLIYDRGKLTDEKFAAEKASVRIRLVRRRPVAAGRPA